MSFVATINHMAIAFVDPIFLHCFCTNNLWPNSKRHRLFLLLIILLLVQRMRCCQFANNILLAQYHVFLSTSQVDLFKNSSRRGSYTHASYTIKDIQFGFWGVMDQLVGSFRNCNESFLKNMDTQPELYRQSRL